MPTVPRYQPDQSAPSLLPDARVRNFYDGAAGRAIAQGLQTLGQGLGQATHDILSAQAQRAAAQQQALDDSNARVAAIQAQAGMEQNLTQTQSQVQTGQLTPDQAPAALEQGRQSLQDQINAQYSTLPQPHQDQILNHLNAVYTSASARLNDTLFQARQQQLGDNFWTSVQTVQDQAGIEGNDPADLYQTIAGMRPAAASAGQAEQFDAQLPNLRHQIYFNTAQAVYLQNRDNPQGLHNFRQQLIDPNGLWAANLSPPARTALLLPSDTALTTLHNEALSQQERQNAAADRAVSQLATATIKGQDISPQQWSDTTTAASGTPAFADLEQLKRTIPQINALGSLPLAEQQNRIDQLKADPGANDPDNPLTPGQIDLLQQAVDENKRQITSDPLTYIEKQTRASFPPLDFSTANQTNNTLAQQLQARMAALQAAHVKDPAIPLIPLKPAEVQGLESQLNGQQETSQQTALLNSLRQRSGSLDTFHTLMGQLKQNEPILAWAGDKLAQDGTAPGTSPQDPNAESTRKTVEMTLRGRAIMRSGTDPGAQGASPLAWPSDDALTASINTLLGSTTPETRQLIKANYLGRIAADRTLAGAEVNPGALAQAIGSAVGMPVPSLDQTPKNSSGRNISPWIVAANNDDLMPGQKTVSDANKGAVPPVAGGMPPKRAVDSTANNSAGTVSLVQPRSPAHLTLVYEPDERDDPAGYALYQWAESYKPDNYNTVVVHGSADGHFADRAPVAYTTFPPEGIALLLRKRHYDPSLPILLVACSAAAAEVGAQKLADELGPGTQVVASMNLLYPGSTPGSPPTSDPEKPPYWKVFIGRPK